jgi:hypothetical protein
MPTASSRRGFALIIALVAMMLLGALIAGTYYPATQELRNGRAAILEHRAFSAGELALRTGLARWDRARNLGQTIGATVGPDTTSVGVGTRTVRRLTRIGPFGFWLAVEGLAEPAAGQRAARRRIDAAVRLAAPTVATQAALTVRGPVIVRDAARVIGGDSVAPDWRAAGRCGPTDSLGLGSAPASTGAAGVAAPDTALACGGGACPGSGSPWITGAPAKLLSAAASNPTTYTTFADASWATLTANADVVSDGGSARPAPRAAGSSCDRADPLNWGDPVPGGPCSDFAPVIVSKSSLTLTAGAIGHGVLLVNGDLRLDGPVRFDGLIVVRDNVVANSGTFIWGAVLAGNASGANDSVIQGDAVVAYSLCAVRRATLAAARPVMARLRGWAERF